MSSLDYRSVFMQHQPAFVENFDQANRLALSFNTNIHGNQSASNNIVKLKFNFKSIYGNSLKPSRVWAVPQEILNSAGTLGERPCLRRHKLSNIIILWVNTLHLSPTHLPINCLYVPLCMDLSIYRPILPSIYLSLHLPFCSVWSCLIRHRHTTYMYVYIYTYMYICTYTCIQIYPYTLHNAYVSLPFHQLHLVMFGKIMTNAKVKFLQMPQQIFHHRSIEVKMKQMALATNMW